MNIENVKWAIPPGLKRCHDDFQTLLKTIYTDRSNTQPLMLIGPPGTGKTLFTETFTKAYCTAHKKDPLQIVPINVAAIPETLIDGMLFGWEKGALSKKGARNASSSSGLMFARRRPPRNGLSSLGMPPSRMKRLRNWQAQPVDTPIA
jgi:hypothetical protein